MDNITAMIHKYLQKENLPKTISLLIVSVLFVISFMCYQRLSRLRSYIISYQGYIAEDLKESAESLTNLQSILTDRAQDHAEEVETLSADLEEAVSSIQDSVVDMSPIDMYASNELLEDVLSDIKNLSSESEWLSSEENWAQELEALEACEADLAENAEQFNENVNEYNYTLTQTPYNYAAKWLFRYSYAYYFSEDGTETGTIYAQQ